MKQIFVVCTCLAVAVAVFSAADTSEAESREERFIGAIVSSTTTLAALRSTTVTRPITCIIGPYKPAHPACVGRRRRRHTNRRSLFTADVLSRAEPAVKVDSSIRDVDSDVLRKGKFLFATRLVTSMTTFTTTFTSTDLDTTVSVSLLCLPAADLIAESFRICHVAPPPAPQTEKT